MEASSSSIISVDQSTGDNVHDDGDLNEKSTKKGRRRKKGIFKSIIQKIETLLSVQANRRPAWLTNLLAQHPDRWISIEILLERLKIEEKLDTHEAFMSKGFLQLLKRSNLLETDSNGTQIRVKAKETSNGIRSNSDCVLYVDNLPGRADDVWLRQLFSHFDSLIDAWVIQPKNKAAVEARKKEEDAKRAGTTESVLSGHRRNKGFGFVQFAQQETVSHVLNIFRNRNFRDFKFGNSKGFKAPANLKVSSANLKNSKISKNSIGLKVAEMTNTSEASTSTAIMDITSGSSTTKIDPNSTLSTTDNCSSVSDSTSSTKRKAANETDTELQVKRPRTINSKDKVLVNGHLPEDGSAIEGTQKSAQSSIAQGDNLKKHVRNRRSHRANRRRRHHQMEINHRTISKLKIYSWTEWHDFKGMYLSKQKDNYSNLKNELKTWKDVAASSNINLDVSLKRMDRYPKDKELRGRDKLILKAEAIRKHQASISGLSEDEVE